MTLQQLNARIKAEKAKNPRMYSDLRIVVSLEDLVKHTYRKHGNIYTLDDIGQGFSDDSGWKNRYHTDCRFKTGYVAGIKHGGPSKMLNISNQLSGLKIRHRIQFDVYTGELRPNRMNYAIVLVDAWPNYEPIER